MKKIKFAKLKSFVNRKFLLKHTTVIVFVLFCRTSFSQNKSATISRDNYYDYLLPKEKVLYLNENEIKIILMGELKRIGFELDKHQWYFLSSKERKEKIVAMLDVPPFLLGIILDPTNSFNVKDREETIVDTTTFKCNQWSDPIEIPYITFKQSCYWYQPKKENKMGEVVTRSIIVKILREDIEKRMAVFKKQ